MRYGMVPARSSNALSVESWRRKEQARVTPRHLTRGERSVQSPPAGTGAREHVVRHERNPIKRALLVLGPGLITGASDDDPSGGGTYAVAGPPHGLCPPLTQGSTT